MLSRVNDLPVLIMMMISAAGNTAESTFKQTEKTATHFHGLFTLRIIRLYFGEKMFYFIDQR